MSTTLLIFIACYLEAALGAFIGIKIYKKYKERKKRKETTMDKYCFMCVYNEYKKLETEDGCVIGYTPICTKGMRRYANPYERACGEIELKENYKQKLEDDETI